MAVIEPRTDTRFRLSNEAACELAARFGTPLYVLDERHLRERIREYWAAFAAVWPKTRLSYASKANGTLAVLTIAFREGCWIDVASEGELRAALAAGVPGERICMHGNNKSLREIEFALNEGVGEIIADNFEELAVLALQSKIENRKSKILLRLAPGVVPDTHEKMATGQEVTKFGFSIADGAAEAAVTYCLENQIPLVGFHCHVGSQLLDPSAQIAGATALASFAISMRTKHSFSAKTIVVGGGLGARYTDEAPMPVTEYCAAVVNAIVPILTAAGLEPELGQEPGRALVAEAGVTLYTVGVVKQVAGTRFVIVDGGLADNPRPALYGAKYEVEHISAAASGSSCHTEPTIVAGRHCETDTLIQNADLPEEVQPGDLLQVLTTGAYASSMASNYNRYPRPATVLLRLDGRAEMVQRSETYLEMLEREIILEDL